MDGSSICWQYPSACRPVYSASALNTSAGRNECDDSAVLSTSSLQSVSRLQAWGRSDAEMAFGVMSTTTHCTDQTASHRAFRTSGVRGLRSAPLSRATCCTRAHHGRLTSQLVATTAKASQVTDQSLHKQFSMMGPVNEVLLLNVKDETQVFTDARASFKVL